MKTTKTTKTMKRSGSKKGYSLFYVLLRNHPMADKEELVMTYTGGRTSHLHEMKDWEYREMCDALSRSDASAQVVQRKKARSQALYWIQKLGIDTLDWDAVNAFCLSPKIAGKEFKLLSISELQTLHRKLRSIHDKGGIRNLPAGNEPQQTVTENTGATVRIVDPAAETAIKIMARVQISNNQYKS